MTPRILSAALLATASLVLATPTFAASIASDNASNPVYLDGWNTGDNGGSGFGGGWTFPSSGIAGHYVGNSAANGGGDYAVPFGDINSADGHAWGLWAHDGGLSDARRPFDGTLAVGQTFSIDMDNGYFNEGGDSVGFGLRNSTTNTNLFEFYYRSGDTNEYRINDSAGTRGTGVGFTDQGLHIEFTLTGPQTYQLIFNVLGASSHSVTGTLAGSDPIDELRLFNYNAGPNGSNDAFFNNIAIIGTPVPLPAAAIGALPLLGLLGIGRARRKQ